MKYPRVTKLLSLLLIAGSIIASFQATPEDIDIFSVDEGSNINAPNVLFVIDNSANWSRASQQWPGGEVQGQSEADAIKIVISELDAGINVGLMEYVTGGSSTDTDHGFVRAHIRPMNATNKATFSSKMDDIYNNINAPIEKRSQSNPFGNLFWDVYNYLAGVNHSNGGAGTPSTASANAYTTQYSTFRSPLTSADTCTRTIVIFIGNNVASGPTPDSTANVAALKALAGGGAAGDAAVVQIPFAEYVVNTTAAATPLGYTNACFSTSAACSTAVNNTACTDQGFLSCACDGTNYAPAACPSTHWNVVGTTNNSVTNTISGPTTTNYPNTPTGDVIQSCITTGQYNALNPICPSASDVTRQNTPVAGQSTRTQTSWSGCSYADLGANNGQNPPAACSPASRRSYELRGTKREIVTVTETTTTSTQTNLGETGACYNDQASCSTTGFNCSGYNGGCACTTAGSTTGCAAGNTKRFQTVGNFNVTAATQTGTFTAAPAGPFMMDEWARFLRNTGVTIPGGTAKSQVTTYTLDVFNAQQDPNFSALLFNAARVGGGKYYQAKDKSSIINALREIFTEVQAVNSAFSSASLPINATNRAQNENQVFIGVFKPDRTKDPLWFGNVKRYQIIGSGADVDLGDVNGNSAINNQTGFLGDCAVSYWTTDSGTYWNSVITDDPDALGICSTNSTNDRSDSPDGPFVEKGAVAEVLRKGNNPSASPDADGNYALNRTTYTLASGALTAFNVTAFDDGDATTDETEEGVVVDFIRGKDVDNDDLDTGAARLTEPRSTIHGDVVHSRPQPVNYAGTTGVVVFYGANDGHFRAVKANTGQELWSFIAPEHFSKLPRYRFSGFAGNSIIKYFRDTAPGATPKDYFFDGSTGVYQTINTNGTSKDAWIFATMRRGGRKVYALDVSDPATPVYLWSKGCPNQSNDIDCDTGFTEIGQTWSLPNAAFIKGYDPAKPVVVMGGGHDRCEDENNWSPGCGSAKGKGVYVLDAKDGSLVKFFDFSTLAGVPARSVVADVALIDVNNDTLVDFAYAADTGGNIYRMDFMDQATSTTLSPANWKFSRVAYTNGGGRKFLFTPALFLSGTSTVYLAIGSGDREHPLRGQYPFDDKNDDSVSDGGVTNRFYTFKDSLTDVNAATATNLDDTNPDGDGATLDGMADYTPAPPPGGNPNVDLASTRRGWFRTLTGNGQGEQGVTSAVIVAGGINFSTNRPTPPETTACSTSLGEARGYALCLLNGGGRIGVGGKTCTGTTSTAFVGGGLPPSPVVATVLVGDTVQTIVIGAPSDDGTTGSAIAPTLPTFNIDRRRKPVYWYKSTGDN